MKPSFRILIVLCLMLITNVLRAEQQPLLLGVSEGTSGGLDHSRVIAKYGGLAELISATIKRKVQVVFVREFKSLEDGMKKGTLDFVLARPSDYPARGVRDYGYQFVASAKPEGQCLIVTSKNSPINSLAEAKGRRWVLPEQISYMSKFCSAELRDQGIVITTEDRQHVREQGAVIFYLDNGFADVGAIASYSGPGRALAKTGHRILHRSVTQPYFPLIASGRISAEQVQKIQAELRSMPQSTSGRDTLKTIGIEGFDTETGERLKQLLKWLDR